ITISSSTSSIFICLPDPATPQIYPLSLHDALPIYIRIAPKPADIHAVRIAAGEADLVLGCDMVVVNDYWTLSKLRAGRSHVVVRSEEHTSELQSRENLVCRLLLEKKKK